VSSLLETGVPKEAGSYGPIPALSMETKR